MNNDRTKKLGEGLSNRHITMISIGGVIGAGLFVGSSSAIAKAGPAVILAYLITSIMLMLLNLLVFSRSRHCFRLLL